MTEPLQPAAPPPVRAGANEYGNPPRSAAEHLAQAFPLAAPSEPPTVPTRSALEAKYERVARSIEHDSTCDMDRTDFCSCTHVDRHRELREIVTELVALRATVARLAGPVTDEEVVEARVVFDRESLRNPVGSNWKQILRAIVENFAARRAEHGGDATP